MGTATAVFATGVLDIQEVDSTVDGMFQSYRHQSHFRAVLVDVHALGWHVLSWVPTAVAARSITRRGRGVSRLDIDAILVANGFIVPPGPIDPEGGATKISIDLDNTLVAVSQNGTSAVIAKKDFGGITIRTNVPTEPGGDPEIPEPTAFVLAGLGLLGLAAQRRRV